MLPALCAGTCLPATAALAASEEGEYVYPNWPALPLAPYARRRTLLSEVVPGQVWVLDQIFGTFYVYVPIRATVLAVSGGLLVYAPVAATPECLRLMRGLEAEHGPVRWVLLPSKAAEHKVLAGPFAREFPDARLFVAPGQFSVPVDLPLSLLGFPDCEVVDTARLSQLPWAGDCDTAALDIGTFGEIALFHRRSATLVVTDTVISIPEDPPPLLSDPEYSKALLYHARDDNGELTEALELVRRRGWWRIALFATFFNPGALLDGEVAIPETRSKRPWKWQPGWETSFRRLRGGGRPLVAPIIRELILRQQPESSRAYVGKLTSWPLRRVVSAHFDCPIETSAEELRATFAFLDSEADLDYCAEDVSFLADLQRSAIPNGTPVRSSASCGYRPRS